MCWSQASYTANLAAFLTVQHLTSPITGLTGLLRVNGTFAVTGGGSTFSYFMAALDPIAAALEPSMRIYNTTQVPAAAFLPKNLGYRDVHGAHKHTAASSPLLSCACENEHQQVLFAGAQDATAAVEARQVTAFLTDTPTLEYYADQLPCDVTVVGQSFGPSSLSFGLPKGSPLTKRLNDALLVLSGNGVLDEVRRGQRDFFAVTRSGWRPPHAAGAVQRFVPEGG